MIEDRIAQLTAAIENLTTTLATRHIDIDLDAVPSDKARKPKPAPKAEAPKAEAPKAEAPKAEAAPEPVKAAVAPAETPAPAATKPTLQDVRNAAQAALDAGKLAEIVALNKEYGLRRISEAPEEKFADIIASLQKALHG